MRTRRSRLPPLTALRAFEAAARYLSFKEAAEELCVSQSAVSHQIKLLEEFLQVRLFERKPRSVELSAKGLVYYPMLCSAFDRIAEATDVIKSEHSPRKLKLHVYATFTIRWLLPRLHNFYAEHPEIEIQLYTAQNDVDLIQDDLHASIMIGDGQTPGIHYEPLFHTELFPVCSPDYYDSHRETLNSVEPLSGRILNVFSSPDDWPVWLAASGFEDLNADPGLQFESYEVALASAVQGMGIAMGQQPYVESDLVSGRLVEVFPGQRVAHPKMWYLACRKGNEEYESISRFSKWLKAQVDLDSLVLTAR